MALATLNVTISNLSAGRLGLSQGAGSKAPTGLSAIAGDVALVIDRSTVTTRAQLHHALLELEKMALSHGFVS